MTGMADLAHVLSLYAKAEAHETTASGILYRVRFQISYGGFYYSESFTDYRDAANLRNDILAANNDGGGIRFFGIEGSDDGGETWEELK